MRKPLVTFAVLAAVSALALTGCSGGASESGTDSKITVGLALSTLDNPFFVSLRDGAQAAADEAGVTLIVSDGGDDATTQANQLQDFQTKQVSAVVVNAVDSDAAGPAVTPLVEAGVPIVAVDRAVNGAEVNSFIASDNVAGGKLAADALAAAIRETGKVIVLQGTAGTSAARDRDKGFNDGIAAYPNIKVVAAQPADFDRTKGLDVATNLLQANPDVVGIFAANDEMALGAIQALGDKAGTSVFVVGFDGTDDGIGAIKAGTMAGSIAQQPEELGKAAVMAAISLAKGETVEATVSVPVVVLTKDTV